MGGFFGTDGIRGPVDGPVFQEPFLRRTAAAIAGHLLAGAAGKPVHAIVGRDTRASGERIAETLALELSQFGVHVLDGGIAPTPAIAKAVIDLECDLGIVITASHNPPTDNGIKLFARGGGKCSKAVEAAIERAIDEGTAPPRVACARTFPYDSVEHYLPFVRSLIHAEDLRGWRIAVDTANGAATSTTPRVLRELGAEVRCIGNQPDGYNINQGVGSEHPERLGELVRETGSRFGLAHDGDADRVVLVDEKGEVVDGDVLLGMIGLFLLEKRALTENTLVATVMSNLGLDEAIERAGGRVLRVGVGDRQVSEALVAGNYTFGGESSGHIIFRELLLTGDGLLAASQVLRIMLMTGRPLSELARQIPLYPEELVNLRVAEKPALDTLPGFAEAVEAIERGIVGRGRILVRYSGTEPKIRLLVEASEQSEVQRAMAALKKLVCERLPVE